MEKDGHFCKTMLPINSFPALFVCAFDPPNSFIEMTPISTAQTDISLAAVRFTETNVSKFTSIVSFFTSVIILIETFGVYYMIPSIVYLTVETLQTYIMMVCNIDHLLNFLVFTSCIYFVDSTHHREASSLVNLLRL